MNCKPGDLAIFVRCELGLNNGRIVSVVRRVPGLSRPEAIAWHVEPLGPEPLMVRGWPSGNVYPARPNTDSACYDDELMPIRPGPISDEEVRDLYAPNTTKEAA